MNASADSCNAIVLQHTAMLREASGAPQQALSRAPNRRAYQRWGPRRQASLMLCEEREDRRVKNGALDPLLPVFVSQGRLVACWKGPPEHLVPLLLPEAHGREDPRQEESPPQERSEAHQEVPPCIRDKQDPRGLCLRPPRNTARNSRSVLALRQMMQFSHKSGALDMQARNNCTRAPLRGYPHAMRKATKKGGPRFGELMNRTGYYSKGAQRFAGTHTVAAAQRRERGDLCRARELVRIDP